MLRYMHVRFSSLWKILNHTDRCVQLWSLHLSCCVCASMCVSASVTCWICCESINAWIQMKSHQFRWGGPYQYENRVMFTTVLLLNSFSSWYLYDFVSFVIIWENKMNKNNNMRAVSLYWRKKETFSFNFYNSLKSDQATKFHSGVNLRSHECAWAVNKQSSKSNLNPINYSEHSIQGWKLNEPRSV